MNQETYGANLWRNIKTNGTTTIPGKWELIAIVVNTKGASSNTAKIYDDTAATPERLIGTIDTTVSLGRVEYGIPMFNGIYIITAVGTAPDLTLIYKPLI